MRHNIKIKSIVPHIAIILIVLLNVNGKCGRKCCSYPEPSTGHFIASYISATPNSFRLYANIRYINGVVGQYAVQTIDEFSTNIARGGTSEVSDSFYTYPFEYYRNKLPTYRFLHYNALAKKYGDTLYNLSGDKSFSSFDGQSPCLIDTVSNISITCDKDYDANHPAGSSLNDIIRVEYSTPKPIIYNMAIINSTDPNLNEKKSNLYRNTSNNTTLNSFNTIIDSNYLIGMRTGINLSLTSPPTYTDLYKFAVVMTLKNGMVFNFPPNVSNNSGIWDGVVKLQGSK